MAPPFERLFSPLTIGPMRLANRIMVAPMERNYGLPDGRPSDRTIEHYARIARGGAGWIDVESTFIDPSGRGRTHQLGLHQDASIDGFRRLAETAHASGARIGVELHHAGRNTSPQISGQTPLAPSPVECPEAGSGVPHELDEQEIAGLIRRYAEAAARAAEAGLDAVELHSAHGYLPLAFLSPLFNQRTDRWGGPLENRMRFALEALRAMRAAIARPDGDRLPLQRLRAPPGRADARGHARLRMCACGCRRGLPERERRRLRVVQEHHPADGRARRLAPAAGGRHPRGR